MNSNPIIERNCEIVKMLGLKHGWWIHQDKPLIDDKKQWCDLDDKTFLGTRVYYDTDLKFHSDWNWLMEAVELLHTKINPWDSRKQDLIQRVGRVKQENTFIMVSDLAKLYNDGKL
jgi:hypothetical protein